VDLKVLYYLARLRPLSAWSGVGLLIGLAFSVWAGGLGIDWGLIIPAAIVVVLIQYVAHPMNDVVDYPVDVLANIGGTGRHKPLISGLATRDELMWLTTAILCIVSILSTYIIIREPLAAIFGLVGITVLIAYNLPPLKLSYKPFSEVFIDIPASIGIVMGITTVAVHVIIPQTFFLGLVFGLMVLSFHAGYFLMDVQSDLWGGKVSTFVKYPYTEWCVMYPLLGCFMSLMLAVVYNNRVFVFPAAFFVAQAVLGHKMHEVRFRYHLVTERAVSEAKLKEWTDTATRMRKVLVTQMNVSLIFGLVFAAAIILFGVVSP